MLVVVRLHVLVGELHLLQKRRRIELDETEVDLLVLEQVAFVESASLMWTPAVMMSCSLLTRICSRSDSSKSPGVRLLARRMRM